MPSAPSRVSSPRKATSTRPFTCGHKRRRTPRYFIPSQCQLPQDTPADPSTHWGTTPRALWPQSSGLVLRPPSCHSPATPSALPPQRAPPCV